MPVDVCVGRRRRHQGHVVEGRQQDAAVERPEVDQPVEQVISACGRLAAVAAASSRDRGWSRSKRAS
jgi:hypothetical protein